MYDAGASYLKLEKLLQLLSQCPAECTIWINPVGNLSIVDASGKFLGFIDASWTEQIVWNQPETGDPVRSLFG